MNYLHKKTKPLSKEIAMAKLGRDGTAGSSTGGSRASIASSINRAVSKAATKAGAKGADKAGMNAAKETAKNLKPSKYPSGKGKEVNIRLQGEAKIKSKSGSTSTTSDAKTLKATKKGLTDKQRLGVYNANETKRGKAIETAGKITEKASQKIIGKEVLKKRGAQIAAAALAADDVRLRMKKSK
jgi:hypothetical protein